MTRKRTRIAIPPSLHTIRQQLKPVVNANEERKASLSFLDRIAVGATNIVGTMGFFFACLVMVTIPLMIPPTKDAVQYISSGYLQLILLPLIMVGQNLQSRGSELRAENDYQVNMKAEREIEVLYQHLEYQNAVLIAMMKKLTITMEDVEAATSELASLEMMSDKIPNDLI